MAVGLQKFAMEDPSFRINTDEESGQTLIHGMGEPTWRSSSTA